MQDYKMVRTRPVNYHRLSELADWKISDEDPDIRGWDVLDNSSNKLGKIDDLLVDTSYGTVPFALVSYGGMAGVRGRKILVPMDMINIDHQKKQIIYKGIGEDFENSPDYDPQTTDYNRYYSYWDNIKSKLMQKVEQARTEEREPVEGRKGGRVTSEGQVIEIPLEIIVRQKSKETD